jgi:hypothetical protein
VRRLVILFTLALVASGCASHLGMGEAACTDSIGRDVATATILNVQAVPSAKYTPCLDELRLGWDSVEGFAEDGRAGIRIMKSFDTFLTVTVTESCDVSNAVAVESEYADIERFEDIEQQPTNIRISIVPSGPLPLSRSLSFVARFAEVEIDDRPVIYTVEDDLDRSISYRVEGALSENEYVWIVDEVDAEEGTLQLRSNNSAASGHGLQPEEALDLIEEIVPGVFYRGDWYFTFDGGCITYQFDAEGTLAETVAADAEDAIGFYSAFELREFARDAGFNIGPE